MQDTSHFGFSQQTGSVHTKRTIMFTELNTLLNYVGNVQVSSEAYMDSIIRDNCLGKRSTATRKYTANYLANLYMLDSSFLLYRYLHYLWFRDEVSRPVMALTCAYARDGLVRDSSRYILNLPLNARPVKADLEIFIEAIYPGRFGVNMIQSLVRNLLSTWTQSGHLKGRINKIRKRPDVGAGAVVYALFLGYLNGFRGLSLFESDYVKLLDASKEHMIELAEEASRRGWFVFKRLENVIEVSFLNFLTQTEREVIREQNTRAH
mgnify:CR=1 FL=1